MTMIFIYNYTRGANEAFSSRKLAFNNQQDGRDLASGMRHILFTIRQSYKAFLSLFQINTNDRYTRFCGSIHFLLGAVWILDIGDEIGKGK